MKRERLWWVRPFTWLLAGSGTAFAALWWWLATLTPNTAAQIGAVLALILAVSCWCIVLFVALPFNWGDRRERR